MEGAHQVGTFPRENSPPNGLRGDKTAETASNSCVVENVFTGDQAVAVYQDYQLLLKQRLMGD